MKTGGLLTVACALIFTTTACAPGRILPVSDIDPSPLFETVQNRRSVFEKGISGTLEMDFKQGNRHFRGRAYVIAFPDGRFRLEVPGFMGSTLLIMAADGKELLTYYPGKGKAYRSAANARFIDNHLPFPLPVDAAMLPALLLGVFPEGNDSPEIRASLLNSGEKRLQAGWDNTELQFLHLFSRGDASLREIHALRDDMKLEVITEKTPPHFPRGFTLTFHDAKLKGKWDKVNLFQGNDSMVKLRIPGSVPVTNLEALH